MKRFEGVTYRAKSDLPEKPGWYYGRKNGHDTIMPFWVDYSIDYGVLMAMWSWGELYLYNFDWFGPVPNVVEG